MKNAALIISFAALAFLAGAQYTLHVNSFDTITYDPDTPNDSLLDIHAQILLDGQPLDPPAYTPYIFGVDGNHPFLPGDYSVWLSGWEDWFPETVGIAYVICDYEIDFFGVPAYDNIELESLSATVTDQNDVLIEWCTNFEIELLGYNILRSPLQDPDSAQTINPTLIPATNTSEPHSYSYLDEDPAFGETLLFYWLEFVTLDSSDIHGPVIVYLQVPNPEGESGSVPPASGFGRIYPNPFRTGVCMKIELSLQDEATLTIFNSRGQPVKAITLNPGIRDYTWDGKDSSGKPCAPGIYLMRLQTPTSSQCKKTALIK